MIGSEDRELVNEIIEKTAGLKNFSYLGIKLGEEKDNLIGSCDIYVTTSTFEGFGLTPLEALTQEKAVVAKSLPIFHAMYGDALQYAESIDDFVKQIRKLEDPFAREERASRGRLLVKRYTWEKAATNISHLLSGHVLALCDDDPWIYC